MKRALWVGLLVLLVVAPACRQRSQEGPVTPVATRVAKSDAIVEAYRLILQRSAETINPATIAEGGAKGLRLELMAEGIVPPDVPATVFSANPGEDLTVLESTVEATTGHYGSKLGAARAEDAVIAGMAGAVGDCHTTYFTPEQFVQQRAWIQGQTQFGGIGASLRKPKPNEPLVIWRVFAGTPAAKAGLHGGDVIQAVDDQDVSSFSVQTVVNLIRGPVGQPVRLTIKPVGSSMTRSVTIVRAQIQPPNVEYRLLPGQIGYLQLYGFPENVAGQVKSALDALDRQGAVAWVIDVRDNGGGSLDAVTQVLSMFVPKNTLLYYLYDGSGRRTDYVADGSLRSRILPAVVLINDGTGSGGEIFAAVLAERGVARTIGEPTAGCVGTGQLFPLPNGGGIQVTVAKLLTGQGKALNRIGVKPDVPVSMGVNDLVAGHDPQLERGVQLLQTGA